MVDKTVIISNTVSVVEGKAFLNVVDTLTPGTYVISGKYLENDIYKEATDVAELEILKKDTNISVTCEDIQIDETATANITLTDKNNNPINEGTFTIYDGTEIIQQNKAVSGRTTKIQFKPTTLGVHNLKVVYNGTDMYNGSTYDFSINVNRIEVEVTIDNLQYLYTDRINNLKFTLTNKKTKQPINDEITTAVKVNGKTISLYKITNNSEVELDLNSYSRQTCTVQIVMSQNTKYAYGLFNYENIQLIRTPIITDINLNEYQITTQDDKAICQIVFDVTYENPVIEDWYAENSILTDIFTSQNIWIRISGENIDFIYPEIYDQNINYDSVLTSNEFLLSLDLPLPVTTYQLTGSIDGTPFVDTTLTSEE